MQAQTVSSLATRLMHFGRFLTKTDPGLTGLAALDCRRRIEPYLASLADAVNSKNDGMISIGERHCRVRALSLTFSITQRDPLSASPARARPVLRSCLARRLSMLRANSAAVAARSRRTRRAPYAADADVGPGCGNAKRYMSGVGAAGRDRGRLIGQRADHFLITARRAAVRRANREEHRLVVAVHKDCSVGSWAGPYHPGGWLRLDRWRMRRWSWPIGAWQPG
jgi:hypothetical protein